MKRHQPKGIPYRNINSLQVLIAGLLVSAAIGLAIMLRFMYFESTIMYRFVSFPSSIIEIGDEYYAVLPAGLSRTTVTVQKGTRVTIDGVEYQNGDPIDCAQWDDETAEICISRGGNPFRYKGTLHFYCLDNLPTMSLSVQEEGLDYIKAERGNTIETICTSADENGAENTAVSATLKVHGNTTWSAEKSSYQIAMDAPTALLGMDEASKWILVSNYEDASGLLNLYAYTLQRQLNIPYAPACRQVNLFINGDYQGMYLLVQKIDTGDVPMVELCGEYTYLEAEQGMTTTHRYMRLRRPEDADDGEIREIEAFLEAAEESLYGTSDEALAGYYDLTSWAQQYLLQELMVNGDTELNSEYFRIENDRLLAGPGWDFDRSLSAVKGDFDIDTRSLHVQGLKDDYMASDKSSDAKLWLPQLYEHASFRGTLQDYYTGTFSDAATGLAEELPTWIGTMDKSAVLDARMWRGSEDMLRDATDRVLRWINARIEFLDSYIGHEDAFEQEITVMDDGRYDVIYCYEK